MRYCRNFRHRDIGSTRDRSAIAFSLIENGVITNAGKSLIPAYRCADRFSARGADLAHLNSAIAVRPPSGTHSLRVMATIDQFIAAINSAIEVDLTGQVNAEVASGVYVGGLGGQLDFMRGANASAGGRAIIALPATTRDGTHQPDRSIPDDRYLSPCRRRRDRDPNSASPAARASLEEQRRRGRDRRSTQFTSRLRVHPRIEAR